MQAPASPSERAATPAGSSGNLAQRFQVEDYVSPIGTESLITPKADRSSQVNRLLNDARQF
ncbi:MAG: hypothetical protein JSR77_16140 [Planctomycetes bacterium]|nr:hypothetical protein [Planctomycetota bacterium]